MTVPAEGVERTDLIECLTGPWYKLPFAVMREAGSATQTLSALDRLSRHYKSKEIFAPVAAIADQARLPVVTVRRHLDSLKSLGWIENRGRERNKAGAPRRTCTLLLTDKAKAQFVTAEQVSAAKVPPYGVLPWFATFPGRRAVQRRKRARGVRGRSAQSRPVPKLPWSARAVLSVILSRLMSLKGAIDKAESADQWADSDDYWRTIANWGDADRFRFTLDDLTHATGLGREPVVEGKRLLATEGFILPQRGRKAADGGRVADVLCPNPGFRLATWPTGPNRIGWTWGVGI